MDHSAKPSAIPAGRGILVNTEPQVASPEPREIAAAMVSAARLIQLLKHGYFDENLVLLVPEYGLVGGVLSILNFRVIKEGHSPAAAMWAVHLLIEMEFITIGPLLEGTPEDHWPDLATMPEAVQESLREDFRRQSAWPPIDDLSTDTPGRDWFNVAFWSTNALWDWLDEGCPSVFDDWWPEKDGPRISQLQEAIFDALLKCEPQTKESLAHTVLKKDSAAGNLGTSLSDLVKKGLLETGKGRGSKGYVLTDRGRQIATRRNGPE